MKDVVWSIAKHAAGTEWAAENLDRANDKSQEINKSLNELIIEY